MLVLVSKCVTLNNSFCKWARESRVEKELENENDYISLIGIYVKA